MTKYYLRKIGDPILRERCKEVSDFTDLDYLLECMHYTMQKYGGYGLAAPQIGDNRRVILVRSKYGTKELVNPKKLNARGYSLSIEGCLSIPFIELPKIRRYSIEVEYKDKKGKEHVEKFKGLLSRIIQHEMDHLNGVLITDIFKNPFGNK